MSIYAQFDNGEQKQFASNTGWGDLCRWAESLDAQQFPCVAHLCDQGYEMQLDQLEQEISAAAGFSQPPEDVMRTLESLHDALAVRGDADAVYITNGMTADDGSDDDDDSAASAS